MKNSLIEKLFSVKAPLSENAISYINGKNEVKRMLLNYCIEGSISETLVEIILGMKVTKEVPTIKNLIPEEILRLEELDAKSFFRIAGNEKLFFSSVRNTGFYSVCYAEQSDIINREGRLVLRTTAEEPRTGCKIGSKAKFTQTEIASAVFFAGDKMFICMADELLLHYLLPAISEYDVNDGVIYDSNLKLISS